MATETDSILQIIDHLIHRIEQKDSNNNDQNCKMHKLISTKIMDGFKFGHISLAKSQIIGHTNLSYAMVNLKPITTGHLLVMPKRIVPRVSGLTTEELGDIWYLAQQMSIVLEKKHSAPSVTFAIQDGMHAGQTIDHVHIHIIPRFPKDFKENDEIYIELEKESNVKPLKIVQDENRKIQTMEEMADEALSYRELIDSIM